MHSPSSLWKLTLLPASTHLIGWKAAETLARRKINGVQSFQEVLLQPTLKQAGGRVGNRNPKPVSKKRPFPVGPHHGLASGLSGSARTHRRRVPPREGVDCQATGAQSPEKDKLHSESADAWPVKAHHRARHPHRQSLYRLTIAPRQTLQNRLERIAEGDRPHERPIAAPGPGSAPRRAAWPWLLLNA